MAAAFDPRWLRAGRSTMVLHVDVTGVGRDDKLSAVATIVFTGLAPKPRSLREIRRW